MVDEQAYMAFLEEIEPDFKRWYIHKHDIAQEYGGPEEGGWWYNTGIPVEDWNPVHHAYDNEEDAYAVSRALNEAEYLRQEAEEDYEFTSVLSYKSTHYSYTVEDHPIPYSFPERRPHYE